MSLSKTIGKLRSQAAAPSEASATLIRRRGAAVLLGLAVALMTVCMLALNIGAVEISPQQVLAIMLNELNIQSDVEYTGTQQSVLTIIRLPRVIAGVLVGATLAVAGALIQGMFRNPLADPGLIGISSGAAFAVATLIVLGNTLLAGVLDLLGHFALPLAAFCGGVLTTLIIYRVATVGGRTNVATMLLAGIAFNSLAGAGVGLMTFLASDAELRDITFWSLGSLGRANWDTVLTLVPFVILTLIALPFLMRPMNAMLLGETEAVHLGVNVERIKQLVVLLSAMAVGAGVSVAGIIGFVGLVVPHLMRLVVGPDHRYVLPGSVLLGGVLMVGADLLARTVAVPAEVPIGIVTALVGAPFFLWLLLRDRNRGTLL